MWGATLFVPSAISGQGAATFKPGLYGDGDASDDRSPHRWMLYAIDKGTGKITPLIYRGIVYVLANHGVFDASSSKPAKRSSRQRLQRVTGRRRWEIYLSNEDGEMLVIEAGATFTPVATSSIGEMLMATPALSDGVMYVRGVSWLVAIGRR